MTAIEKNQKFDVFKLDSVNHDLEVMPSDLKKKIFLAVSPTFGSLEIEAEDITQAANKFFQTPQIKHATRDYLINKKIEPNQHAFRINIIEIPTFLAIGSFVDE